MGVTAAGRSDGKLHRDRGISVSERARKALAQGLRVVETFCDEKGYVERVNQNVLCHETWPSVERDLLKGAGDELGNPDSGAPPKFCAAHSSSALVVNAFGPWRDNPSELIVAGLTGFSSLLFEQRCNVGVKGTAPHLDVVACTSDTTLGVESKCTEFLQPKAAAFAAAYERINDGRRESAWFSLITDVRMRQRFAHLDAAQLVKHYLGLANRFPSGRVVLLYLFWEPLNAGAFGVFDDHRRELHEFAQAVEGDRVEFKYQSYPELWREWDAMGGVTRRQHVAALRKRYLVSL